MSKKFLFTLMAIFAFAVLQAQPAARYFELVDNAKSSYNNKQYKKAGQSYSAAFKSNGNKAYMEDRYNAARAWAMAGSKDSAFVQLFKVVNLYDYLNFAEISTEPAFKGLYADKRWADVEAKVKLNVSKSDGNLNRALVLLLDSVYRDYHNSRLKEVSIKNEFGEGSAELKEIRKTIVQKDSVNLKIVTDVLDTYGWLGRGTVGFIGNYTLALMIQQAALPVQEKYLPVVMKAFQEKNIEAFDYAMIYDKVTLRKGQPQLYGSVIVNIGNKNYVAPVTDPENLNKRRSSLGLISMSQYLSNWGMKWDLNKYKKDLLLLEKEKPEY